LVESLTQAVGVGESEEALRITVALQREGDLSPDHRWAFVEEGNPARIAEEWGENDASSWALAYLVPCSDGSDQLLVVLERDGALLEIVGLFPSVTAAVDALSRRGAVLDVPL